MITDRHDNRVSGASHESIALYNRAAHDFCLYRGDPVGLLDEALACAPGFTMATIAKAWILATLFEPVATNQARQLVADTGDAKPNDREASHLAALDLVTSGALTDAAILLDRHSMRFPRDLLALQAGHLLDFYRGNARNLRDRIGRALPAWSADDSGHSFLLGMHAFGLEECGQYSRAEETGRHAVAVEPNDVWAHHAVAHVMEMQGRAEDGIGWMSSREPLWSSADNAFKVHNWWHRALFHLELGQHAAALALYDGPVRKDRSAVALDLVDASALLWRLQLAGVDVGDRWQELADTWQQHIDGTSYPFNDWHAAMALLGAGMDRQLDRLRDGLRAARGSETAGWARRIALPLVEGFVAFHRADYATATEHLYRNRYIVNAFGGSHAQRDVIDLTLAEAALRGGLTDMLTSLANERLAHKPHSWLNRRLVRPASSSTARNAQAA